jgi:hypothetical protein
MIVALFSFRLQFLYSSNMVCLLKRILSHFVQKQTFRVFLLPFLCRVVIYVVSFNSKSSSILTCNKAYVSLRSTYTELSFRRRAQIKPLRDVRF